jgi:hypothetical protein
MEESGNNIDLSKKLAAMSMPIRNQLFSIAANAIEDTEKELLKNIDDLVHGPRPYRDYKPSNPVILGLCIRRLSLYYRRIMMRYKSFNSSKSCSKLFPFSRNSRVMSMLNTTLTIEARPRYEAAKQMYDATSRHYARVYNRADICPFRENWNIEDHRAVFEHNADLIKKFKRVKAAEVYHCKCLTRCFRNVHEQTDFNARQQ